MRAVCLDKIKLTDKQIYIVLIVVLIGIAVTGAVLQANAGGGPVFTEEQSLEIARNAVLGSPTYVFDGYEMVLKDSSEMPAVCENCWIFLFEFKSSHAGYGDREGQFLAQVITEHTASVVIERGQLKSAVLDDKWNIMTQDYLPGAGPPSPQEPDTSPPPEPEEFTEEGSLEIARQYVLDSPTYKFDGYGLEHNETIALRCPECWQFIFKFESSYSGYGNRLGENLSQAVTEHTAKITVIGGEVSRGILDEKWDMDKQELLYVEPPEPAESFCGWSTNASCNSDAGCKTSGCSNHVCISLSQFSITTTCEWRDCYNSSAYSLSCKCVENICQWAE
jgi:eight-cysteine-cluster-containing protein